MPEYTATCGYCFKDTKLRNKNIPSGSTRIWTCHKCRRLPDKDRYYDMREREYQAAKYYDPYSKTWTV